MNKTDTDSIIKLLKKWQAGDDLAEQDLLEMIYPWLYQEARRQRRKQEGFLTLSTGDIANEAILKFTQTLEITIQDQVHLKAMIATVTRNIVIDYMRKRFSKKRGGLLPFVSIDNMENLPSIALDGSIDWLGIQSCLDELRNHDHVAVSIVKLKFFSAMTYDEIAIYLDCSRTTVRRKWRFAKAWLSARLQTDQQILNSEDHTHDA